MENGLILKVWEMDYEFLLKNYLNPEMWEKTWTLFQYKNYTITLNLYSIYVRRDKILFDVHVKWKPGDNTYERDIEKSCEYSLKLNDIQFLKRAINTAIWDGIRSVEENYMIKETDEWLQLCELGGRENDNLTAICEEFLDEKDITNDNIREAYIEAYLDEYAKVPEMKSDFINGQRMKYIGDFALVWAECLDIPKEKELYVEKIKKELTVLEYEQFQKQYEEYKEYMETKEFKSEMEGNLEDI